MNDERLDPGDQLVSLIRRRGFIGSTHFCPKCFYEFWADHGLHAPDCAWAAEKRREGEE